MEAGSWKLEAGGWKLEVGGWRLEDGGWRFGLAAAASLFPGTPICKHKKKKMDDLTKNLTTLSLTEEETGSGSRSGGVEGQDADATLYEDEPGGVETGQHQVPQFVFNPLDYLDFAGDLPEGFVVDGEWAQPWEEAEQEEQEEQGEQQDPLVLVPEELRHLGAYFIGVMDPRFPFGRYDPGVRCNGEESPIHAPSRMPSYCCHILLQPAAGGV